jgi:hypothetical protein
MAKAPGLGAYGRERALTGLAAQQEEGKEYERVVFGQPSTGRGTPVTATAWQYPDSSRVKAFSYDFDTHQLRVRFKKYDTPWVYENVPVAVYQAFASAPSLGKYINSTLNFFPYRRATPMEDSAFFTGV